MRTYVPNTPPTEAKSAESAKIASDVEAFLKRGGRIVEVDEGESGMNPMGSAKGYAMRRDIAAMKARAYHIRRVLHQ